MQTSGMFRSTRPAWLAVVTAAMALHAPSGIAQTVAPAPTPSPDSARLETVTVTAQKREEKAQDVPIATTVIGERQLERAGVVNIQDAAALTPNLVIIDQLRPGIQTISFRGFTTVQGGQSPFAIVVDGVTQPGQEFLKQPLFDIQQIEVLRGPQGTLYGAGAIAGAINITTKPPTDDFSGDAKVGFAQGRQKTEQFSLSGPLSQGTAWWRIGLYHIDFGGLITNETNGERVDFSHETTAQGELLFKPTSQLSIDLRAHGTDGRNGGLWLVPVSNADFDDFHGGPQTDMLGRDYRVLQTYSAKLDYSFDKVLFTSITGYNRARQFETADGDFSSAPIAGQTWTNNSKSYSEEFRLTSTDAGPLKWNLGAYAQRYEFDDITQFGLLQADGEPFFAPGTDNVTLTHSNSFAGFGQATYDFDAAWSLTGGIRYDSVHATGIDPNSGFDDHHVFSEPQPKVSLAYRFTPDLLSYATYSRGFRTGGFNPNTPLATRLYQNEVSDNYELGAKSTWLDNTLLVNGAIFHTEFKNQQYFFSQATADGIFRVITNIPKTKSNGAEAEAKYRANESWSLDGSVGYNDTTIKKFDAGEFDGNRLPQVYSLTSAAGVEYQHQILDSAQLVARVDWAHRGAVYWDTANIIRTPAKDFFNARVAINWTMGQYDWQFALYGRNLSNERTPAAVGANALGPGESLRSANEPRQLGAELAFRF